MPKIYGVNWFRKVEGKYIWPGFGDNSRVLKWIFERCDNSVDAVETPIGYMPKSSDLDVKDIKISQENLKTLLSVDKEGWKNDLKELREYYKIFGKKLPKELKNYLETIEKKLN